MSSSLLKTCIPRERFLFKINSENHQLPIWSQNHNRIVMRPTFDRILTQTLNELIIGNKINIILVACLMHCTKKVIYFFYYSTPFCTSCEKVTQEGKYQFVVNDGFNVCLQFLANDSIQIRIYSSISKIRKIWKMFSSFW